MHAVGSDVFRETSGWIQAPLGLWMPCHLAHQKLTFNPNTGRARIFPKAEISGPRATLEAFLPVGAIAVAWPTKRLFFSLSTGCVDYQLKRRAMPSDWDTECLLVKVFLGVIVGSIGPGHFPEELLRNWFVLAI